MDKPISVGDLVVVLRGHCEMDQADIGWIFRVQEAWACGYRCKCGANTYSGDDFGPGDHRVFERAWLKRIPPLAELDGKKDAADKPITLDGEIERLRKMVQA